MKMRYVRTAKEKRAERLNKLNPLKNDPMDYDFPEIEEFYIYNPKGNTSGNMGSPGARN